jgi:hypothetical protein
MVHHRHRINPQLVETHGGSFLLLAIEFPFRANFMSRADTTLL